jgi:anti-sigma B factor antagonist
MKLKKQEFGEVTVVSIDGKLVGGKENSEAFHGVVDPLFDSGRKWIVVDLAGVTLMNSQGIGMLIGGFTRAKNAGGLLTLAQVPMGRIREIFVVTELNHVFRIFDTTTEALGFLEGLTDNTLRPGAVNSSINPISSNPW